MLELLSYVFIALPYVIAVLLGLCVPLLCIVSYSRFGAGVAVIATTFALQAWTQSTPILRLGITLFIADIPMILIGLVAGIRWLARDDVPRRHLAWVVFAMIFFVGLVIGLGRFGTGAGVQARGDYYSVAAASYAMSFPVAQRQLRQIFTALVAVAGFLLLLCAYRWTVYYGNIRDLLPPGGVYNDDGAIRVIGAGSAMLIAQALLLGLFFVRNGGAAVRAARLISPLLLGAVLALQHRSVWLAALVGVGASLTLAGVQRTSLVKQVLLIVLVALLAALPVVFSDNLSGQVEASARSALAGQGTVSARFENWRVTLDQWRDAGPRAIVMGQDPGSDTTRIIDTENGEQRRIRFGAHNQYVSALVGSSVLGLAAFLWVVAYVVWGLYKLCRRGDGSTSEMAALLTLIVMQLAFAVAYSADYFQFMLLGAGLAYVAGLEKARGTLDGASPALKRSAGRGRPSVVAALHPPT